VALCIKRMPNYALDNADIVREAMLRQFRGSLPKATEYNGRASPSLSVGAA